MCNRAKMLFCAVCFSCCGITWGAIAPSMSEPKILDVHWEAIESFLGVLLPEYLNHEVSEPVWGIMGPLPSIKIRVGKRGPTMELDAQDGTVYFFMNSSALYKGEGAERPMSTVLTADDAFALACPVLKYYGLPVDRDHYSVEPDSRRQDVGEGRWEVRRELAYDEMESVKSFVRVLVRVYTKRVEVVAYIPPVPPEPIANEISRAEAIECARKIVENRTEYVLRNVVFGKPGEVTKVIKMPWRYKLLKPQDHPYHSRYCWSVPYRAEYCDLETGVWEKFTSRELIDAETGEEVN